MNGEILKWLTRADCKSAGYAFVGSNPALPTNWNEIRDLKISMKTQFETWLTKVRYEPNEIRFELKISIYKCRVS